MKNGNSWNGQNIPRIHNNEPFEKAFAILPVLEFLLEYDEDTVEDLLPSAQSYGWEDDLMNNLAWANNYYRIVDFEPEFSRYGCLPRWFPNEDNQGRRLSDQGRVDRFLYLLDQAYGGLPDDHRQVNPRGLVQAILELNDNLGAYLDIEEGDGMHWELVEDRPEPGVPDQNGDH